MTDTDTLSRKMREAAERATPGKWSAREEPGFDGLMCICPDAAPEMGLASFATRDDAAHIVAAQPANVLDILDERDALRAALTKVLAVPMAFQTAALAESSSEDVPVRIVLPAKVIDEIRAALGGSHD